jgi:NAD(P)-dependent dehydrogenase (short-subunit alcohol dehydrogenase family)
MKIIIIGATGKIGSAIVAALAPRHQIIAVSRSTGDYRADITDAESLAKMLADVGLVDAVVVAAGGAAWKPLMELTDADFAFSLGNKLMGQVNLARIAIPLLRDNGSITLTSGIYGREPVPSATAVGLVNSAIEGFARAAALDLPRGLRINVVSPPLVGDLEMAGDKVKRMPSGDLALAYVECVEGTGNGQVIDARPFARL